MVSITIKIDEKTAERIDRAAATLSEQVPGLRANKSDAARAALVRGLEAIESETSKKNTKR